MHARKRSKTPVRPSAASTKDAKAAGETTETKCLEKYLKEMCKFKAGCKPMEVALDACNAENILTRADLERHSRWGRLAGLKKRLSDDEDIFIKIRDANQDTETIEVGQKLSEAFGALAAAVIGLTLCVIAVIWAPSLLAAAGMPVARSEAMGLEGNSTLRLVDIFC
jgi:hypothetical protein